MNGQDMRGTSCANISLMRIYGSIEFMSEDFPPGVDQVPFSLVNRAIYLKCVKANKVIARP